MNKIKAHTDFSVWAFQNTRRDLTVGREEETPALPLVRNRSRADLGGVNHASFSATEPDLDGIERALHVRNMRHDDAVESSLLQLEQLTMEVRQMNLHLSRVLGIRLPVRHENGLVRGVLQHRKLHEPSLDDVAFVEVTEMHVEVRVGFGDEKCIGRRAVEIELSASRPGAVEFSSEKPAQRITPQHTSQRNTRGCLMLILLFVLNCNRHGRSLVLVHTST